jgi:hypothetical protein
MLSGRTWMNWQALKSSRRSLCGATTGADGARVGRAVRARMGAMMAEHGLGLWHFAVLSALDDSGPASQRELGARLRIDPGDLVEVAGRLEDAGTAIYWNPLLKFRGLMARSGQHPRRKRGRRMPSMDLQDSTLLPSRGECPPSRLCLEHHCTAH